MSLLSCVELLGTVKESFSKIADPTLRKGALSLKDCLLSGYALFSLKYPSSQIPI